MINETMGDIFPMAQVGKGAVLEVLNPRGELKPPAPHPPSERLADLSECKVGLYWNGKLGADHFMDVLAELVKQRFPSSEVLRLNGVLDPGDAGATALSDQADAFVYGVGD